MRVICICALKRAFIKWQERIKLWSLHIIQSPPDGPYQEDDKIKLRPLKTTVVRIQIPLVSRTLLFLPREKKVQKHCKVIQILTGYFDRFQMFFAFKCLQNYSPWRSSIKAYHLLTLLVTCGLSDDRVLISGLERKDKITNNGFSLYLINCASTDKKKNKEKKKRKGRWCLSEKTEVLILVPSPCKWHMTISKAF